MLRADYSGIVVFLGLPGLRFTGAGVSCGSGVITGAGASATTSSGFTFFGRTGFFLGLAGMPVVTSTSCCKAVLIFLGLPGLLLTGTSVEGTVEVFKELVIGVGLVEVFIVEFVGSELGDALKSLTFLGLPGLRFSGWVSSTFGSALGFPLFTSVKSGLTR